MKTILTYLKAFWAMCHLFSRIRWSDYVHFRQIRKDIDRWQITL